MNGYHYHKNKTRKGRQFYDVHSIDKVISHVIEVMDNKITSDQIKGPKRDKEIKELRLSVYWICFYIYNMPVTFIAKNLGNRHHSTIINGRDRMEDWYDTDREFKAKFDDTLKKFEHYHSR